MTNTYDRFNSWKGLIYADKMRHLAEVLKEPHKPDRERGLPMPVNWHIYPHNTCNHRCNFCIMDESMNEDNPFAKIAHFGEKQRGGHLDKILMYKAVNDSQRLGIKLIHWSGGGEPLLNPDLPEVIKYQHEQTTVKSAMSTNGLLLDRLMSTGAKLDHLRVSINAGNKENYERIGQYGWNKVMDNMKRAVDGKLADHIGIGFVLTQYVKDDIADIVDIAENLGVEFIHIRPAFWPKHNQEILDAVKYINVEPPKSDKVKIYMVTDKFEGFWNDNRAPCRATPLHAALMATGELAICQDRTDLRFGDYSEHTFEELWESDAHYEVIKRAQACRIRCVETNLNNQIEHMFVNNDTANELL